MGIQPDVFGPYLWAAIHFICLGAPTHLSTSQKDAYRTFFHSLPDILPCRSCGKHLYDTLQKLSIEPSLTHKDALFAWSVKLHNIVNEQLGKQQMTEEDAIRFWSSAPSCILKPTPGASSYSWNMFVVIYYIMFLLIGFILGYLYFSKTTKTR
jgi:hypothetical protein